MPGTADRPADDPVNLHLHPLTILDVVPLKGEPKAEVVGPTPGSANAAVMSGPWDNYQLGGLGAPSVGRVGREPACSVGAGPRPRRGRPGGSPGLVLLLIMPVRILVVIVIVVIAQPPLALFRVLV